MIPIVVKTGHVSDIYTMNLDMGNYVLNYRRSVVPIKATCTSPGCHTLSRLPCIPAAGMTSTARRCTATLWSIATRKLQRRPAWKPTDILPLVRPENKSA